MATVNHFYAEDLTERTTTSTTFVASETTDGVGKIAGSNLAANTKYLIIARAVFDIGSKTEVAHIRLTTADDTDIAAKSEAIANLTATGATYKYRYLFVRSYTTDASPADLQWEHLSSGGANSRIDMCSLLLIDLDDLGSGNYIEAFGDSTAELAVAASWTDLASITTLDSGKNYLVLGYARCDQGSVTESWTAQLVDGASNIYGRHQKEGEDITDKDFFPAVARVSGATSTTVKIQAQEESATADMLGDGSYLIALDLARFRHFDYSQSATGELITATSAGAPQTIESLSFTRSGDGNHLALGSFNNNANARAAADLTYGGTALMAGDIDVGQITKTDSTDDPKLVVMSRENITTDATLALRTWYNVADDQPTSEYEFIGLLDLELAAVAADVYPPFPRRQPRAVRM